MNKLLTVTLPNDTDILVARTFNAPRELVLKLGSSAVLATAAALLTLTAVFVLVIQNPSLLRIRL